MEQRSRELSVRRQRERLPEKGITRRIENLPDRVRVREGRPRDAHHFPDGGRQDLLVVRLPVDEAGNATRELAVELLAKRPVRRLSALAGRRERRVLGRLFERDRILEHGAIQGIVAENFLDHAPHHFALLRRRVERLAQAPIAK